MKKIIFILISLFFVNCKSLIVDKNINSSKITFKRNKNSEIVKKSLIKDTRIKNLQTTLNYQLITKNSKKIDFHISNSNQFSTWYSKVFFDQFYSENEFFKNFETKETINNNVRITELTGYNSKHFHYSSIGKNVKITHIEIIHNNKVLIISNEENLQNPIKINEILNIFRELDIQVNGEKFSIPDLDLKK